VRSFSLCNEGAQLDASRLRKSCRGNVPQCLIKRGNRYMKFQLPNHAQTRSRIGTRGVVSVILTQAVCWGSFRFVWHKSESSLDQFPITRIRIYDRPPPEGADRSGLNDCHSRICSDTSLFSRSSVAFSHRRRSSLSRPSTNPTRPDLCTGLSRLPYPTVRLLLFDLRISLPSASA
jgi:hypothetical protein